MTLQIDILKLREKIILWYCALLGFDGQDTGK